MDLQDFFVQLYNLVLEYRPVRFSSFTLDDSYKEELSAFFNLWLSFVNRGGARISLGVGPDITLKIVYTS